MLSRAFWGTRATYVVDDTRVLVFVRAGKGYAFWERDCSVTDDLDLDAIRVELCTAARVVFVGDFAFVEADHFGADEIATNVSIDGDDLC